MSAAAPPTPLPPARILFFYAVDATVAASRPLHDALRRLIKWIYNELILPTVLRMHRWGVLEALAW